MNCVVQLQFVVDRKLTRVEYPTMKIIRLLLIPLVGIAVIAQVAYARVVRVEILSRSDISGTFGTAGAYERITGRVYFAFDPRNPENR